MSLEDALQTPIDHDGIKFARLDMDDLAAWAAQIKATRKIKSQEQIKLNSSLDPLQRMQMTRAIEEEDIQIYELLAKVQTPAGIRRVLTTALRKSGQCSTDEQIDKTLKGMHFTAQRDIAYDCMSPPAPEKIENPPEASHDTDVTGAAT